VSAGGATGYAIKTIHNKHDQACMSTLYMQLAFDIEIAEGALF
jgi:hypothetical protein